MAVVKPPKVVLALIANEGKFLLIKRRKQEGNLHWAFPGGKVLENEEEHLAVVREAKEEVGLHVAVKEKLFERKHPETGFILAYYSCELVSPEVFEAVIGEPEEIERVEWVPANEVPVRFTSDIHPLILEFVGSHVRNEDF